MCRQKEISSVSIQRSFIHSFIFFFFFLLILFLSLDYSRSLNVKEHTEWVDRGRREKENSLMIYSIPLTAAICHPSSSMPLKNITCSYFLFLVRATSTVYYAFFLIQKKIHLEFRPFLSLFLFLFRFIWTRNIPML